MESTPAETAPDPAWLELAPLLDEAMAQLGATDRDAIVLRYFENKTLAEVGVVLGLEERAAQKRVSRAVEKLRKLFAKHGVASPAAMLSAVISAHAIQAVPAALAKSIAAAAILKGAAASSSTLTLIHGALKAMAWSKAKTAIVTSLVVLFTAGTTAVAVQAVKAARTKAGLYAMQGNWLGNSVSGKVKMRLVLKILKTNDTYRAVIDSVDQGVMGIPVAKLSASPHSLHAELPALDAEYEATLNADGTALTGTWKQMNQSIPLTFQRATEATPVVEALPPDDYAPRAGSDLQGAWQGVVAVGNVQLHLNLRIAEPASGTFHAQLDSVDQGVRNMNVDSLTYHKPAVQFALNSIGAEFEGSLNDQLDQLAGNWSQMGNSLPVTFKHLDLSAQTGSESGKDYGHSAANEVQGHWKGALDINKVQLRLVIHIARKTDGSYSAEMDSPDQGATGIPASETKITTPNVRLDFNGIAGFFTGKLEKGALSGTWHQAGQSFPLKLERAAGE
jgi:hypothetical protein